MVHATSIPLQPDTRPKALEVIPIPPPPVEQRVVRGARFPAPGEKKTRYDLPPFLDSPSPVGYRIRLPMTRAEAAQALQVLALDRPTRFAPPRPVAEGELFEECSLGILSSRQSTNYRGHRQVTFGPDDSSRITEMLRHLSGRDADVLGHAAYTHVVFAKPYRTPFTALLTFVGHVPVLSLATVAGRALNKKLAHADDIPTIGYLKYLHVGVLADAMERAAVVASAGRRRAQVHLAPFWGGSRRQNRDAIAELGRLCGLSASERAAGWRLALVGQVGEAVDEERVPLPPALARKLGANLLAFRSERIQPGVNQPDDAAAPYLNRQAMDVPETLTVQAGRAAYNAFAHWSGCDRERAKQLLLLDRIDVLTPRGKARLRAVRAELEAVTDRVAANIPWWADLPTGRAISRNVLRARRAFALAGQRIYLGGLSRREVEAEGLSWERAVCAVGAAAARSAVLVELMGCVDLPEGCDLLAGTCLMAGPVNQNDIAKQFFDGKDLLAETYPDRDPTVLLVWTLKAKTVADPVGNEEQLLDPARKGALVDLRAGPHEAVTLVRGGALEPMRRRGARVNAERAFGDQGNFVTDPDGREIPGNRGAPWPDAWRREIVWP